MINIPKHVICDCDTEFEMALTQPPTGHLASHSAGELEELLHGVAEQTCLHVTDVFDQVLMSQGAEEHVFWLVGLLVGPLVGGFINRKGSST